jgi:hypothetical protein
MAQFWRIPQVLIGFDGGALYVLAWQYLVTKLSSAEDLRLGTVYACDGV